MGSEHPRQEPHDGLRRFGKRVLLALGIVAVLIVLGYAGAAFMPRWWSHRIADQAGGSFAAGIALGLFYGAVFTALPLALLRWAFRKRRRVKMWLWSALVAALLAAPNLLTLGVVLGTGDAAHAGERTLDVDAPGFRASSLIGALVVAAALIALEYLVRTRRWSRDRARGLREELRRRDEPFEEPAETTGTTLPPGA